MKTQTEIVKERLKGCGEEIVIGRQGRAKVKTTCGYEPIKQISGKIYYCSICKAIFKGMQITIKSELEDLKLFWRKSHDDEDCVNWVEDKIKERITDCKNALKLVQEAKLK